MLAIVVSFQQSVSFFYNQKRQYNLSLMWNKYILTRTVNRTINYHNKNMQLMIIICDIDEAVANVSVRQIEDQLERKT